MLTQGPQTIDLCSLWVNTKGGPDGFSAMRHLSCLCEALGSGRKRKRKKKKTGKRERTEGGKEEVSEKNGESREEKRKKGRNRTEWLLSA